MPCSAASSATTLVSQTTPCLAATLNRRHVLDTSVVHQDVDRTKGTPDPLDHADNRAFPLEKSDAILAINLSAALHAIRAALPEMQRRGFARIVNVASAHGLIAPPFKSAYAPGRCRD